MNEVKLISQPCAREGYEHYMDLYVCWFHNGKKYFVRVRPQFAKDFKLLLSNSQHIERGETVEKYL